MEEMELEEQILAQPEKKPVNKKKIAVIASVVVVVLVAAVVACLYLFGEKAIDDTAVNAELNFSNGGKFAYDEDTLYYIGRFNETDEGASLYSTDYNGENRTQISTDGQIVRIRVVDDRIYFQKNLDAGYCLGAMKTDGSEPVEYVTTETAIIGYAVWEDTLLYTVDQELHTLQMESMDDQVLCSGVEAFTLDGDALYYCVGGVVNKRDMSDGSEEKLCDAAATKLAVGGDKLYILCDDGLYSASANKESVPASLIADDSIGGFVFMEDKIYYNRQLSEENIETMIAYMTADVSAEQLEDVTWAYRMALTGCGELYSAPREGGSFARETGTNQQIVYSVYSSPDGLLCKPTILSNGFEKIEFNAVEEE